MQRPLTILLSLLLIVSCGGQVTTTSTDTAQEQTTSTAEEQFAKVFSDITRKWLLASPQSASSLGVSPQVAGGQYNQRLNKTGLAARQETIALVQDFVRQLEGLQQAKLSAQHQQMVEVQLFRYRQLLDIHQLVNYGTPYLTVYGPQFETYAVAQMNGPHVEFPSFMQNDHEIANEDDAEAFIMRLEASSQMLAGLQEEVQADAKNGVIPPDFIIQKTAAMLRSMVAMPPEQNSIYTSFVNRIDKLQLAQSEELKSRALAALAKHTYEGYLKLADTVESYLPQAVHEASLSRLPKGEALYDKMILLGTDSQYTADELHKIGLDGVKRIHAQMNELMLHVGRTQGTVPERLAAMSKDPELVYPDTEEFKQRTLDEVRAMIAAIDEVAPQYFGTLPKTSVEVRRVPTFREETSAAGYYNGPSEDGSRPGIYYLNLRSTSLIPTYGLPTITYHEAVPGHHFQVALGLEQSDLPLLHRINTNTNAFAEGWGLYSERLAWEMGMYKDKPLADIGRLYDELHRAVRLVVDTGMHSKGWSREKAIDYMASTKGSDASGSGSEVVSEIERYVAMPGQALGYMVGMLKILELRDEAKTELGDKFDIRAFHDAVLTKGGLPLPILEKDVQRTLGVK